MSWSNKGTPNRLTWRLSSAAANAGQELMLATFDTDVLIVAASFVPETAMVTDTDSGFLLQLITHDSGGTLSGTVGSYTATTAAGTLPATVPVDLTIASGSGTVEAGEVLTWKESTIGTGTARSNGVLIVEYTDL